MPHQKHLILLFLFYFLYTVVVGTATKPPTKTPTTTELYEKHASDIIDNAAERMQHIWNRKRDIFLSIAKGRGYNVINQGPIKQGIDNDYRNLVHGLATNLSTIPIVEIKNQTLRRQVKLLSKLQLYGLNSVDYDEIHECLHKMKSFINMQLVCLVNHKDNCKSMLAMVPGIEKAIIRIRRVDDLNYYWLNWRKNINNNNKARNAFQDYVRLFRKAAALNGHVTPSRTWYLNYETENFQSELENVVWEIMPLYKELHAYLRYTARKNYGEKSIESDGAIPAPIFEQMLLEAWISPGILMEPYPKEKLPAIQARLEEIMVQSDKLTKKAAEYFESLGMNRMSSSFYEKFSRRMHSDESGPECKSEVYYFPPDVGLRYCTEINYKKFMQMHGHMAEVQSYLYKRDLPFGLDREPCPGFGAAIAETTVIASGTPRHLYRLHILANESLTTEKAMNRLFRMAVHTILAIPQYFINDKFLVDVLDRRISFDQLNCGYWKLQYKYAGVVSPDTRSEKHFDPDHKFYRGLYPEKSNTIKFLSEVLGHQLYRSFCLSSGQYRPGDTKFPLHNCDFYGNTKTGDIIKEMMKSGATRHWRDVLETATGERKLSGTGIMEYFAPLFIWLKEKNKELGLDIGWDSEMKCKSQ